MSFWRSPETLALRTQRWRAARDRMKAGEGFIYVAEVIGTDVIKIGFSLTPETRAPKAYLNWCPVRGGRTRLVAKVRGSWEQEKDLHHALCDGGDALGGEYYHRSILTHPAIPEALRSPA
jgi:hypothetical protein